MHDGKQILGNMTGFNGHFDTWFVAISYLHDGVKNRWMEGHSITWENIKNETKQRQRKFSKAQLRSYFKSGSGNTTGLFIWSSSKATHKTACKQFIGHTDEKLRMLFFSRKSRSIRIHLICQSHSDGPFHAWAPKGQCFLDHSWSKDGGANTGAALADSSIGAPPSFWQTNWDQWFVWSYEGGRN